VISGRVQTEMEMRRKEKKRLTRWRRYRFIITALVPMVAIVVAIVVAVVVVVQCDDKQA
jgi:Mn2+/Fe2+ NRAMP family transporter